MSEEEIWKAYHFICDYKAGVFGIIPLKAAINKYYDGYQSRQPLKEQIGEV